MLPKRKFPIQITNERLLDSKRGTIKRSAGTRTYSLWKKTDAIIINPALPYDFGERHLTLVEGKIDLSDESSGEYQLEIITKPSVKTLYIIYLLFVPVQIFLIVTLFHSLSNIQLALLLLFFPPLIYRYIQIRQGIKAMTARLKADRAIFIGG